MKLFWMMSLILVTVFSVSCSTYRGQNRITDGKVKFPGGVYEDKTWNETLTFKRKQFYMGATLYYDILAAKIDKDSPFMNWLGENKASALRCDEFYVLLIYRNIRRAVPEATVLNQIEKQGGEVTSLPDFKRNIRGHFVSDEMHFLGHKNRGVCFKSEAEVDSIEVSLPGFQQTDLI